MVTGIRDRAALPRPVLVAVIALPLLLVAGAAVIALVGRGAGGTAPAAAGASLALPAVPAPAAGSADCAALLARLPQRIRSGTAQLDRRPLADPAPPGAAAWGVETTAILRCGLDRPAELTRTAELLEVSGVRWLRLTEGDQATEGTSTWVAVDRPVYVVLTVPDTAGTGPLQDVSTAIGATLPARQVEPVR